MASKQWEAWEAYTVGNRRDIGVSHLYIEQEPLNNGGWQEYISAIMGDGNHFIFRSGHPQYEEIKAQAKPSRG